MTNLGENPDLPAPSSDSAILTVLCVGESKVVYLFDRRVSEMLKFLDLSEVRWSRSKHESGFLYRELVIVLDSTVFLFLRAPSLVLLYRGLSMIKLSASWPLMARKVAGSLSFISFFLAFLSWAFCCFFLAGSSVKLSPVLLSLLPAVCFANNEGRPSSPRASIYTKSASSSRSSAFTTSFAIVNVFLASALLNTLGWVSICLVSPFIVF